MHLSLAPCQFWLAELGYELGISQRMDANAPVKGHQSSLTVLSWRDTEVSHSSTIFCPHPVYLIDDPNNSHWQAFVV